MHPALGRCALARRLPAREACRIRPVIVDERESRPAAAARRVYLSPVCDRYAAVTAALPPRLAHCFALSRPRCAAALVCAAAARHVHAAIV